MHFSENRAVSFTNDNADFNSYLCYVRTWWNFIRLYKNFVLKTINEQSELKINRRTVVFTSNKEKVEYQLNDAYT